jgi:hypothetical protein
VEAVSQIDEELDRLREHLARHSVVEWALLTASREWKRLGVMRDAFLLVPSCARLRAGAARGGDKLGAQLWSWTGHDRVAEYPVSREQWRLSRGAGFARNQAMVDAWPVADLCLAFIRDGSHGAIDCANRAETAGIPTFRFTYTTGD